MDIHELGVDRTPLELGVELLTSDNIKFIEIAREKFNEFQQKHFWRATGFSRFLTIILL